MPTSALWRIHLPFATFGIECVDGIVTRPAPIAGWSVGKPISDVLDYYRQRKAAVAEITIIRDEAPAPGFSIIVCGGRHYANRAAVFAALDQLHARPGGIALVIEGGANGADLHARAWATVRGVKNITMPAEWSEGRRAGPQRNRAMLARLTSEEYLRGLTHADQYAI